MDKVLIIAQAPPLKKQIRPMDSTLLEQWLSDAGFHFLDLSPVFDFEAISDKFPGVNQYGGHMKPKMPEIMEHWPVLELKIKAAKKIWVMGSCASDFLKKMYPGDKRFVYTIHPCRRNIKKYRDDKHVINTKIRDLLREWKI